MNPERYEHLSRLFAAACDLPPEGRAAFVQEQCAGDEELRVRLLAMLASDTDATPFLEVAEPGPVGSAAAGDRIGRFRIVGVLATGGMGVVYEAEQDHPRRRVALKVMRAAVMSPGAARRFRVEAELLGRLDHPGVARVYDAGVHRMVSPGGIEEEIPYFAMELVAGEPVTEAARRLPLAERLKLMARICDAVHHAHQRGVIHRDLKPANILVTPEGNPKILDFGVARATGARSATVRTHAGQLVGTLAYMSPEQVAGDPGAIDVRTDVYALGATLYEMLTQRPVHDLRDVSIPEALRIIREEGPRPLAAADRSLRGDMEVIVGTALIREPDRRYASAAELAADLRRFCRNEPIQARPASAIYHLRKLARRRQPAFIGVTIALAAIVLGGVASALLAVEMNRQRAQAQRALDDSRQVSAFLLDLFLATPDEPQVDRVELLRRAERRLHDAPPRDIATRAKLHEYIGHGYLKTWSQAEAASHLEQALALRESLAALDADLVKATHLLAMQRIAAGRAAEAEDLLRLALERRRQLWGEDHLTSNPDPELLWYITHYTPDEPEVAADATRRAARRARAADPGAPPAPPTDLPLVVRDDFAANAAAGWETELHGATGWSTDTAGDRLLVSGIDVETDPGKGIVRLDRRLPEPLGDYWLQARVGWQCDDVTAIQTLSFGLLPEGRQHSCYLGFSDGWVQATGAFVAHIATDRSFFTKASGGGDSAPLSGEAVFTIARTGGDVTIWWNDEVALRGACSAPATELFINFVASRARHLGGTATFGRLWIDDLQLRGRLAQ